MKRKIPSLNKIVEQFIITFDRFPLALISSIFTTMIILYLLDVESRNFKYYYDLSKIAFVTALGVPLFTALRLFSDKKNLLCIAGIISLVLYYFYLPSLKDAGTIVYMRHIFLNLMFFITIFWASYYKSNPTNEEFWEWTQSLILALFTSIFFTIILYGGLSGALFAIDKLFSLHIAGKRYGQLFFSIVGFFSISYFLSQIPKKSDTINIHSYSKVENIFTKYILTPITVIYFFILYLYTFKILIESSFPKGILAWIIIAFSIVAITTYLFWTPLWSKRGEKYRRFFPLILFLQTIMLGIAVKIRIQEYGWTENRYMVSILGVWLFFITLYFLLFKGAKYKWIFITLSIVIAISQIGPFSAYGISKISQQNRLKELLKNSKQLSENSDIKVRYEISDIISYLSRRYSKEGLKPIIPKIVENYDKGDRYSFARYATKELGFKFVDRWQYMQNQENNIPLSIYRPMFGALDVKGYDYLIDINYFNEHVSMKDMIKTNLKDTVFELNREKLEIKEHNKTISTIPLSNFFKDIFEDKSLRNLRFKSDINAKEYEKLNFIHKDENVSIKLMILDMFADRNNSIQNIRAKVLYKRF